MVWTTTKSATTFSRQKGTLLPSRVSGSHMGVDKNLNASNKLYKLPLWVNHSMKHILHRHEIKKLRAPKVNILKHVIGAKPASHA